MIRRLMIAAIVSAYATMPARAQTGEIIDEGRAAALKPLVVLQYGIYFGAKACADEGYVFTKDDVLRIRDEVAKQMSSVPQSIKDEVWTMLTQNAQGKTTTNDECSKFRYTTIEMMMPGVLAPDQSEQAPF